MDLTASQFASSAADKATHQTGASGIIYHLMNMLAIREEENQLLLQRVDELEGQLSLSRAEAGAVRGELLQLQASTRSARLQPPAAQAMDTLQALAATPSAATASSVLLAERVSSLPLQRRPISSQGHAAHPGAESLLEGVPEASSSPLGNFDVADQSHSLTNAHRFVLTAAHEVTDVNATSAADAAMDLGISFTQRDSASSSSSSSGTAGADDVPPPRTDGDFVAASDGHHVQPTSSAHVHVADDSAIVDAIDTWSVPLLQGTLRASMAQCAHVAESNTPAVQRRRLSNSGNGIGAAGDAVRPLPPALSIGMRMPRSSSSLPVSAPALPSGRARVSAFSSFGPGSEHDTAIGPDRAGRLYYAPRHATYAPVSHSESTLRPSQQPSSLSWLHQPSFPHQYLRRLSHSSTLEVNTSHPSTLIPNPTAAGHSSDPSSRSAVMPLRPQLPAAQPKPQRHVVYSAFGTSTTAESSASSTEPGFQQWHQRADEDVVPFAVEAAGATRAQHLHTLCAEPPSRPSMPIAAMPSALSSSASMLSTSATSSKMPSASIAEAQLQLEPFAACVPECEPQSWTLAAPASAPLYHSVGQPEEERSSTHARMATSAAFASRSVVGGTRRGAPPPDPSSTGSSGIWTASLVRATSPVPRSRSSSRPPGRGGTMQRQVHDSIPLRAPTAAAPGTQLPVDTACPSAAAERKTTAVALSRYVPASAP